MARVVVIFGIKVYGCRVGDAGDLSYTDTCGCGNRLRCLVKFLYDAFYRMSFGDLFFIRWKLNALLF